MIKKEKREAILLLRKNEVKVSDISKILKVSRKTVSRIIYYHKVHRSKIYRNDKICIDSNLLKELYHKHNGIISDIHKYCKLDVIQDISYSTLTKLFRENNINRKSIGIVHGRNYKGIDLAKFNSELNKCLIMGNSYIPLFNGLINNNQYMLNEKERNVIIKIGKNGNSRLWKYGIAIDVCNSSIGKNIISKLLHIDIKTVHLKIKQYNELGFENFIDKHQTRLRESTKVKINRLIEILHHKPNLFGINRSTWNRVSIANVYNDKYNSNIAESTVGRLINKAGYKMKKAKSVLTSPDPDYKEKVETILNHLHSLHENDVFFFIDELGPLQVKRYGGRCYTNIAENIRIPKIQISKGSIIIVAAINAVTNQMTWCYVDSKNSFSMIKLIEILFNQYYSKSNIYITWDAASWHSSNELEDWLNQFNNITYKENKGPIISFLPLPTSAQFLDVIESIFSGMKRAVIHHSDYNSVDEMKLAISKHFSDRNIYFKNNPKRVGKKIWEIDFFLNYNNLKHGDYMTW